MPTLKDKQTIWTIGIIIIYKIIQYDWEPVLIQRKLIGFETILEIIFYYF